MPGPGPASAPPPLQSNGWLVPFQAIATTPYTLTAQDGVLYVDATAGAATVNLPLAASVPAGTRFAVKKSDASGNAVTLTRAGADTIDGGTTVALAAQFNSVVVVGNGVTQWLRASNAVATGGI